MAYIIAVLLTAAILLFPIFLNIHLFFDIEKKKCCFSVYLLRFIRLHGGYITVCRQGIALHLSQKKAVLVPFRELLDTGKKFEITRGFILYGYSHLIEIGSEEFASALCAASLARIATCIASAYVVRKKHYSSFKGDVVCRCGNACFKVSVRLILLFNLALLLIALCKLLLRNILEKAENGKIG